MVGLTMAIVDFMMILLGSALWAMAGIGGVIVGGVVALLGGWKLVRRIRGRR